MSGDGGYQFDRQSIERIGRSVRKTERMGLEQTSGYMAADPLVPFQIQRFRLVTTWSGSSASAYRVYWTGSAWAEDTSKEYTVYSDIAEPWDGLFNNGYPTAARDYVIAYHRHDCDRWVVLTMNQNHRLPAKCQADWTTGTYSRPHVSVKLLSDDRSTEVSDAVDAYIDIAWDGTYYAKPAPELFSGDYCSVTMDQWGTFCVDSPISFSYLQEIRIWHSSSATIPTGWVLCDGSALPAGKKVSATNAPDLRARVPLGVGPSTGSIGTQAGDATHNHDAHDIAHSHTIDGSGYTAASGIDYGIPDTTTNAPNPLLWTLIHSSESNYPPHLVTRFIYRYK